MIYFDNYKIRLALDGHTIVIVYNDYKSNRYLRLIISVGFQLNLNKI